MIYMHGHKLSRRPSCMMRLRTKNAIKRVSQRWGRRFVKARMEARRIREMKKLGGIDVRNYMRVLLNEQKGL